MRFIPHPAFGEETSVIHNTPSILDASSTLSGHAIQVVSLYMCYMFISYVQGKYNIIWHSTPTLLMSQYCPHLFGVHTHDLYLVFLL